MRILLLLLFLIPATAEAQQQIESWQSVRDSYFKIVIAGDTLQDDFNRLNTAEARAYELSKTSQGAPITIVGANYRFEYKYFDPPPPEPSETDTVYIEADNDHPYLRNVDWTYIDMPDTTAWELRLTGDSIAEEIIWKYKCVGTNSIQYGSTTIVLQDPDFDYTRSFECDQILTWDLTARTDTMELGPRKYFIDVAMFQALE